jgi:hypothetical protein
MNETFPGITSDYGFKIEGDYNRTVPMDATAADTYLTGPAPLDPWNTITVTSTDGTYLDWAATLGMDAVIVKGGNDGNVYVYPVEAFSDTDLHSPINPNNGQPYGISHVEFCYDYELEAEKTATGTFDQETDWTITKDDSGDYDLLAGQSETHGYKVSVTKSVTRTNPRITGTITISNSAPFSADVDVSDVSTDATEAISATVTCPSGSDTDTVPAATASGPGVLTCDYVASDGVDGDEELNTATVDVVDAAYEIAGATATAEITFSATNTGEPDAITVIDDHDNDAYDLTWNDVTTSTTWSYSATFTCSTDEEDYSNGTYTIVENNTATIEETGESDSETVTVVCHAPVVTKSADEFFTRYWDWTITKDYPGNYGLFAGQSVEHDYAVSVDPTSTDDNWRVSGTITVANSHPSQAMALTSITDDAGGIAANADCGGSTMVPADDSLVCTYDTGKQNSPNANPFGDTNTATVGFAGANWVGTAPIAFPTDPTTEVDPVITVDDDNLEGETWSADRAYAEWSYTETFECSSDPADYTGGTYSFSHTNTAIINETEESDSERVTVDCYAPTVDKDATAEWNQSYDWTITKGVDPEAHTGFIGDVFTSTYDVVVERMVTESFGATGTIYVTNPAGAPNSITVDISDAVDAYAATVDCGGGSTNLMVEVGTTGTCSYTVDLPDSTDRTNTVTATFNTIPFTATAPVDFSEPTSVGYQEINVTDYFTGTDGVIVDPLGSASSDQTFTYSRPFECPMDESLYTEGTYTASFPNTARIDETGQSDDANVALTCYSPVVSKDADTEWFEEYEWTITKAVNPASHTGFFGDTFTSSYDVTVDQTVSQYGYRAFGSIYVTNPAGEAITVDVADEIDGTSATIDCDPSTEENETSLAVDAGATGSCAYTVDLPDNTDRTNVATVTFNGIDFTATADVDFGEATVVGYPTINVTDYFNGDTDGEDLGSASSDRTFEYERPFECPTDESLYTEGLYTASFPNTAEIDETGQQDDANVDVTCYQYATKAGTKFRDLNRNGARDEGEPGIKGWTIDFWTLDAQGQPDTKAYTATTDTRGSYAFDMVVPGTDYLVCEVLPDDWTQSYPTAETPGAAPCPTELGYAPYGYRINLEPGQEELSNDFGNWTTQAQPDIDLEKYVSVDDQATWHDADDPTGPYADAGSDVYFKFVVTNVGNVELSNITLSDSDFDVSGCTLTDPLAAGGSFECVIGPFDAIAGQHANTGETTGDYEGNTYSDTDDAHYFGEEPAYTFQKYINGEDADTLEEAVSVEAGDTLTFTYMLTNTGNVPITWTTLTDDVFGDLTEECELPVDVPVGETATCDISRVAQEREQGQQNIGTASVEGLEDQTDPAWYRTSTPTPVELLTFRAQGIGSAIRLEWSVAAEIDMSGYYLYRAESSQFGLAQRLGFQVAEGSYSTYEYVDKDVEPGKTYWYWLVSIETNGTKEREGPVQASMATSAPGGGFQIYLPFVVRGH